MDTAEIVRLYTVEHLTMQAIATQAGVSRVAIWKRLKKAGITTDQGVQVTRPCLLCGALVIRKRCHAKRARVFCSRAHYAAYLRKAHFKQWRHGTRIARATVSRYFALERGHVVHHHDGNQRHNWPKNLAVFASQAEHVRYHRGGSAVFLWDGRTR